MRGKVFLPIILTVAALLFCFPAYAQEQRAGCLVTAAVEEIEEQEGDGEPSPSPLVMTSPLTGKEDNDILIGPPEQDGGPWVFLGVDLGSVCGWLMLLLFFLLLLLLLCLIAWLARRKADREQRENVQEKGRTGGKENGS